MSRKSIQSGIPTMALAILLISGITAACAPSSPSATSAGTPTATLFIIPPTPTPEHVTQTAHFPFTLPLYLSPDGTLVAAQYDSTIKLYTLSGQELGSPYTMQGGVGNFGWFADSSEGYIIDRSGLHIMDRQGQVHPNRFNFILDLSQHGFVPDLSQNGQWFGGTSSHGAEIVPRNGGLFRVLAPGGVFMGWQNNRAIYTTGMAGSDLYAFDPASGTAQFLAHLPSDEEPMRSGFNSPDGHVLIFSLTNVTLQQRNSIFMMLAGNRFMPFPSAANGSPFASTALWIGQQHDLIARLHGEYVIEDIVTGKVIHDTGVAANQLGAVVAASGDWMVTFSGDRGPYFQLTLVNCLTNASYVIDPHLSFIVPLGNQGKFLAADTEDAVPGPNDTDSTSVVVVINPTLIA